MIRLPRARIVKRGTWPRSVSFGGPPRTMSLRLTASLICNTPWSIASSWLLAGGLAIMLRAAGDPRAFSLALLLIVCGGTLVVIAWQRGQRACRLLRDGIETTARLDRQHTLKNGKTWIVFVYRVHGRDYSHDVTTATPSALVDDPEEPIVYDPSDPQHAALLDELPGNPRIDGHRLVGGGRILFLVGPVLALVLAIALVVQLA